MLGGNEFRLRRGFAGGKTLVRRTCAAGQKAGLPVLLLLSQSLKISILTVPAKTKGTTKVVPFILGSAARRAAPPFGDANARGRQSRPSAKVFTCGENTCTAHLYRPTLWGPTFSWYPYCFAVPKPPSVVLQQIAVFLLRFYGKFELQIYCSVAFLIPKSGYVLLLSAQYSISVNKNNS